MNDATWAWADMRWRHEGWLEAFRLRLTGWLPSGWAEAAIDKGVVKRATGRSCGKLELTVKGRQITEVDAHRTTEDTLRFTANVLCAMGYEQAWFEAPQGGGWPLLAENEKFDDNFAIRVQNSCRYEGR